MFLGSFAVSVHGIMRSEDYQRLLGCNVVFMGQGSSSGAVTTSILSKHPERLSTESCIIMEELDKATFLQNVIDEASDQCK